MRFFPHPRHGFWLLLLIALAHPVRAANADPFSGTADTPLATYNNEYKDARLSYTVNHLLLTGNGAVRSDGDSSGHGGFSYVNAATKRDDGQTSQLTLMPFVSGGGPPYVRMLVQTLSTDQHYYGWQLNKIWTVSDANHLYTTVSWFDGAPSINGYQNIDVSSFNLDCRQELTLRSVVTYPNATTAVVQAYAGNDPDNLQLISTLTIDGTVTDSSGAVVPIYKGRYPGMLFHQNAGSNNTAPLFKLFTDGVSFADAGNQPPTVSAGSNQTITLPENATLIGTATDPNGDPMTFAWSKLTGPGNVTFSSPASLATTAGFSQAGSYQLQLAANDGVHPAVHSTVTITVNPAPVAPSIQTQPASQTVTAGQTATLTVTASGAAPLSYQWKHGSADVGANSATLSIANTQAAHAGTYTVVVSNAAGIATSNPATLTVNPLPNQPPVIQSPASALPNPVVSAVSTTVAVTANDPDGSPQPLVYTWSKLTGPGTVTFSVNGTNSANTTTAIFSASGAYSLQVNVSDGTASVTSQIAGLVVTLPAAPVAPSIQTQPASQTVTAGQTATLTVTASGAAPLSYQWKHGSADVGANSATLSIANTQAAHAGTYTVVVSNAAGTATSNPATLTVNPLPPPTNPITVNVPTVDFTVPNGAVTPVSQTITLTNTSGSTVTVAAGSSQVWLTVTPAGATVLLAGQAMTFAVTAAPAGLSGSVSGTVTFTNSPGGMSQTIPVQLTVSAPATTGVGVKKGGCAVSSHSDWTGWLVLPAILSLTALVRQRA